VKFKIGRICVLKLRVYSRYIDVSVSVQYPATVSVTALLKSYSFIHSFIHVSSRASLIIKYDKKVFQTIL